MIARFTLSLLERALDIVKDAVAVETHTLEVPVLIECDRHYLLGRAQLFYNIVVSSFEDLDIALVE